MLKVFLFILVIFIIVSIAQFVMALILDSIIGGPKK